MKTQKYFHLHFLTIVFCFWFSTFIYIPIFGIYLELNQIGYYATGIIMGSYGIMQIVIRFPMGVIADKYHINGKLLVALGFVAAIISSLFLILSGDFLSVFLGRFLAGVTAAMWVVLTIWYSSSFDEKQSLKAMGQLQATTVGSQLLGMTSSSLLASIVGYTGLFWIGGLFAVIGLVLVFFLQSETALAQTNRSTVEQKPVVLETVKSKHIWSLSILSLIGHAVLFVTIFGFSPVYLNQLNPQSSAIMILTLAFMVPHVLAPILLSIRKEESQNPYLLLTACFTIGSISLFFMWSTSSWLIYTALHVVLGLTLGLIFPILLNLVYQTGPAHGAKTVMGFYQSLYSIGIVFGPIIGGYFSKMFDLESVFFMSAFLSIVGSILSGVIAMNLSKVRKINYVR